MRTGLRVSLLVSLFYAGFRLVSAVIGSSFWEGALAFYYILLCGVRWNLIRQAPASGGGTDRRRELRAYRTTGVLLMILDIALGGIAVQIVRKGQSYDYPGSLIFAMGFYAFYCLILSGVNMVKYRKFRSPVLSAAKAVNLTTALVAMFSLETAMVNRQEYLRQNKREDVKLSKLYDEETTRLNNIQSWRKVENASQSGVISFYTDGYESVLSAENIASLSAADINTVLAGERLTTPSVKETAVYRIVNQDCWYVALVTDAKTWNPVVGQPYTLQMEGFEDLSFTAFVTSVQKESGSILAVFQINDPIGPLIYQRTGRAKLTATISGLSVSSKALSEENGQIGVWLIDVGGETFIPVEVLSSDGSNALIQPLVDGALGIGQAVRIK